MLDYRSVIAYLALTREIPQDQLVIFSIALIALFCNIFGSLCNVGTLLRQDLFSWICATMEQHYSRATPYWNRTATREVVLLQQRFCDIWTELDRWIKFWPPWEGWFNRIVKCLNGVINGTWTSLVFMGDPILEHCSVQLISVCSRLRIQISIVGPILVQCRRIEPEPHICLCIFFSARYHTSSFKQ